jgi:hypothetical protein
MAMKRFDLARFLFGDWRSAAEAHIANAVHLLAVLFALWVAREQGVSGPTFDFISISAMGTTAVFGLGRLARTPKPAETSKG